MTGSLPDTSVAVAAPGVSVCLFDLFRTRGVRPVCFSASFSFSDSASLMIVVISATALLIEVKWASLHQCGQICPFLGFAQFRSEGRSCLCHSPGMLGGLEAPP